MSDDFGKSWKYILEPDTENDGIHEIIIPNQEIAGKITHESIPRYVAQSRKALFRIEVINHIATATTDGGAKPDNGGFEVIKNSIQFQNLPKIFVKASRNALPPKAEITATTNCNNPNITWGYREEDKGKYITRTWEAKDRCNNVGYFVQNIEVERDTPTLSITENVKKDKTTLYPNPANDSFSLDIQNVKTVKLYNTAGQVIKTFAAQQKYDISTLVTGIYIVAVETENGMELIKLIKK